MEQRGVFFATLYKRWFPTVTGASGASGATGVDEAATAAAGTGYGYRPPSKFAFGHTSATENVYRF